VRGWVTVFGPVNHLGADPCSAPRPTQPEPTNSVRLDWAPAVSCGSKQAHRVIHRPVSVVSQCGAGAWLNGLASGDPPTYRKTVVHQRRVRDDALYKSTVALLTFRIDEQWLQSHAIEICQMTAACSMAWCKVCCGWHHLYYINICHVGFLCQQFFVNY